jgi:putative membrane protein
MFLDIIAAMLLGILIGILTGIIPGIHPNTVFITMVSAAFALSSSIDTTLLLVFIMALAVSNTFLDFIPSIMFGAPDPSTALSVLPGHRLLLDGGGYEAVVLTVIGGLGVALLTLLTLPILLLVIPFVYFIIRPVIHILLVLVVLWMLLTERGWGVAWALAAFLFSGTFGVVTLNGFGSSLLFPSLTGLFAFSTLLESYYKRSVIPEQRFDKEVAGDHRKGILTGWVAGWFAGMLPGVGASQAGVLAAQALRASTKQFLSALGGINTSNILFTFIMFYSLGRTRSGAVWAISQFTWGLGVLEMMLLVLVGITAAFMSAGISIALARSMLVQIRNLNYQQLNLVVILFLGVMVLLLSGLPGLVAGGTGACIGLLAIKTGIKRSHLMGYLLLPTMLYFSGLTPAVLFMAGL